MSRHTSTARRFAPFLIFIIFALTAASARADDGPTSGLLWRIEGAGPRASYLFGTVHSDDPGVTRLPSAVTSALDGARSVSLELLPNMETQIASAQAMLYTDGTRLSSVIGLSLYTRTRKAASAAGLPVQALESMKPWAVMIMLSMPPPTSGQFLDFLIYQRAEAAGKRTYALETYQEQLGVFEDLSVSDQKQLLKNPLDELPAMPDYFRKLLKLYQARDLAGLRRLSEDSLRDSGAAGERLMEGLMSKRNRRMVERMQARLQEGGAFIAVGALHLSGADGLVRLLQARGLKLSKVY